MELEYPNCKVSLSQARLGDKGVPEFSGPSSIDSVGGIRSTVQVGFHRPCSVLTPEYDPGQGHAGDHDQTEPDQHSLVL